MRIGILRWLTLTCFASLVIISTIFYYCSVKLKWLLIVLLPLALMGVVLAICFCLQLCKTHISTKRKVKLVFALSFYALSFIVSVLFIILAYEWWYWQPPTKYYILRLAIAIIVPIILLIVSMLLWVSVRFSHRPSKTAHMQVQIDELQKQVDELKKGE